MGTIRRGRRFLDILFLLSLITPAAADAQTRLRAVSTLGQSKTAASRIETALESVTALSREGCRTSTLRQLLSAPEPLAILTTSDCLAFLEERSAVPFGPGLGAPVYFFTLDDEQHQAVFKKGAPIRIGILSSNEGLKAFLNQALLGLQYPNDVVTESAGYSALLSTLRANRFDAIGVFDDGTGTALNELDRTVKRSFGNIRIRPVSPIDAPGFAIVAAPAGIQWTALIVPPQQVEALWLPDDLRADEVAGLLRLPASTGIAKQGEVAGARGPVEPPRGWERLAKWWRELGSVHAGETPARPPLESVLPILVTKGVTRPRLDELLAAFKRALLAAPIDALINPCDLKEQTNYRAFLRSAIGDVNSEFARLSALWEHASMLAERREPDADEYLKQRARLEEQGVTQAKRQELVRALHEAHPVTACRVTKRSGFSGNVAYYQRGVQRLRDAINEPSIDRGSAPFEEAASCLQLAFKEQQTPTCGAKVSGMWSTYYAPYLALAVLEAEDIHGGR